ncbi:DUF2924 domain-containing protein [Stappia sp. GBMRC 2046]|uniref:DUF2924 domain-containing protein n=1 Tax=Stappia sediminis TaxID=2692190 RepID=A0A7X3LWM6_9HYPH|nr:DUF2924 domain-containing protein [Stappia sediminis]MXN66514.1 DUF2924 domain-containing protein [Stappia sediminis]
MRRRKSISKQQVREELAHLPEFPPEDLKTRWQELYGAPPPKRLGRLIMIRAIAHRLQEMAFGGVSPATRRRLKRLGADLAAGRVPKPASIKIKPGTRLLREWQGEMHEAIVLEREVVYRGQSFRSLSAVAREITGTPWSGPVFFGLKERVRGSR